MKGRLIHPFHSNYLTAKSHPQICLTVSKESLSNQVCPLVKKIRRNQRVKNKSKLKNPQRSILPGNTECNASVNHIKVPLTKFLERIYKIILPENGDPVIRTNT